MSLMSWEFIKDLSDVYKDSVDEYMKRHEERKKKRLLLKGLKKEKGQGKYSELWLDEQIKKLNDNRQG